MGRASAPCSHVFALSFGTQQPTDSDFGQEHHWGSAGGLRALNTLDPNILIKRTPPFLAIPCEDRIVNNCHEPPRSFEAF